MSKIAVVFIENNRISLMEEHYRKVMDIINNNFRKIKPEEKLKKPENKRQLDAGYILIDLDRRLMLDCQSGFSIEHLNPRMKLNIIKDWYYLNHPNW